MFPHEGDDRHPAHARTQRLTFGKTGGASSDQKIEETAR